MSEELIDIEPPPVLVELPATVQELAEGRPVLAFIEEGRWLAVLKRLVGKPVRVALTRDYKKRTSPQNRYLHGVVYVDILEGMRERARELGSEPPFRSKLDVHAWAKWKWLRTVRVFPGGEEEEVPGSTRKLTTKQFAEYVDSISLWGAERGLYVRKPHEAREVAA